MTPLWAKPNQCFDKITANDMYSNLACAWSGSLVLFGGLGAVMWVLNRSLSLHLQICWQIIPGKRYFYGAQVFGWGLPALLLGLSLGLTGVSYRFGNVCHINHDQSIGTFWGPILGFAAIAAILQSVTFGYCIRVYLKHLWDPNTASGASSSMPSQAPTFTGSSIRTKSARATYRRVRKVVALQWRGVVVVMILLISAIYFAIVFQIFDNLSIQDISDPFKTEEWVLCLVENGGKKDACLGFAAALSVSEPIVSAVLVLLAMMGYWCLLFLGRLSMFLGWWEVIKRPFSSKDHFVSVDARRISDPRNYEMLTSPPQTYHMTKGPSGGLIATAKPSHLTDIPLSPLNKELYHQLDESPSEYFSTSPTPAWRADDRGQSFSQPRTPSRSASQQQRVTFSREGPTPTTSPYAEWPIHEQQLQLQRPAPILTSPIRSKPEPMSSQINAQTDIYQPQLPRNASAMSQSSTTHLRSGSALDNHNHNNAQAARGGSALGRDWPAPAPVLRGGGGTPSPTGFYRSNSRTGNGSALGSRGWDREWDPASTHAKGWVGVEGGDGIV